MSESASRASGLAAPELKEGVRAGGSATGACLLAERERLGELRGVAHEQLGEAGQVHPARAALERRHGGRSEQIMGLVALEQRVRHENLVRPPHAGHRVGPALRREPIEERVAQLQNQPALL